ncbi:MAG: hypothetical protein IJ000_03415 [Paludibacteraceae bacterium]|nr:hypothetical protein [Paludibacteraceae bacterium]
MKKIIPILCLGMLLMTSCIGSKKATNPEVLQGSYLVDLPELISQFELSEDLQQLNSSVGSMLLSKIEVVVKITDTQITIEGPERFNQILEVAKIVALEDLNFPVTIDYQVKNNTDLWITTPDGQTGKIGSLKKMGEDYSIVKATIDVDENGVESEDDFFIVLNKQ